MSKNAPRHRPVALAFLALGLMTASSALAAGGGGGGGSMPSQSAPEYDPAVEYQKGTDAFKAQNYKDAVTAFRRVVQVVPRNAPAQYLLGASYMALGDFKKARSPLEVAVKRDGELVVAKRDLGITLARLGLADKAREQGAALTLRKAACGNCADALALADAISQIETALSAGPRAMGPRAPHIALASLSQGDTTYVAAVGLINEHRYDEAIALLKNDLWITGPHPDILTYLGFSYRKIGQYEQAQTYYEEALAIAPHHRGALEYYGELKLEIGDIAGAKNHLQRLEAVCSYGCYEADELRRWIAQRAAG